MQLLLLQDSSSSVFLLLLDSISWASFYPSIFCPALLRITIILSIIIPSWSVTPCCLDYQSLFTYRTFGFWGTLQETKEHIKDRRYRECNLVWGGRFSSQIIQLMQVRIYSIRSSGIFLHSTYDPKILFWKILPLSFCGF